MNITVLYKCLDYHCLKHKVIKVKYLCPNFTVIDNSFLNDYLPKELHRNIGIEEQVDDWVLNLDKSNILIDNDLHCIVDWTILINNSNEKVKPKLSKKEQVFILAKKLITNEKMLNDFAAIYGKMFNSIKKRSAVQQFEIVISAYNVSLKAVSNTYQDIIDYNQKLNSLSESPLIRNPKHPYLVLDKQEIKKLIGVDSNHQNILDILNK